jgi:hypothetical protein
VHSLRTGIAAQHGLISYPLVEVLIPLHELCIACSCCGAFESQKDGEDHPVRFKRCARCKQAFYVRPVSSIPTSCSPSLTPGSNSAVP